jgi:eukaryotic-like serine/threonine-protein kinase
MSRVERSALDLGRALGRGGQGTVYPVANVKINKQWAAVYKEYRPEILPTAKIDVLELMADLVPRLPLEDGTWLCEHTSWPAALVTANGAVSGFLMRGVPQQFQFVFRTLSATQAAPRLANFEFLLNTDDYVANIGLKISERDRLVLLADLAAKLHRMHRLGIAVGDLSPKNLLFSTGSAPRCFVIDCDAMRVRGVSVMPQVETPEWEVPAGEEKATAYSDAYKLGLLAIRLFARDQNSTDPGPLRRLSPALGDLARDSLSAIPTRRPLPAAWIELLQAEVLSASTQHAAASNPPPQTAAQSGARGWAQTGAPTVTGVPVGPAAVQGLTVNPVQRPTSPRPSGAAGAGTPSRPTSPRPQRGRRRGVVGVLGLLLAAGLVVGVADGLRHTPAASGAPVSQSNSTSNNSVDSPTDPAAASGVPATSAPPTSVGMVQIDPGIAGDSRAAQVAAMFNAYFSGIDDRNYPAALAEYDPNGVVNPNDPKQASEFEQAVSTSNDTDVDLLSIGPGDPSAPASSARLTFQSHQAAGYGPAGNTGETCTDWNLTYVLTQSSAGGYLIHNTPSASDHRC